MSCQNLSKISTWTLLQLLYWLKTKEQSSLHQGRVKFLRQCGLTQRPAAAVIVVFRANWRASDVSQRMADRLEKKQTPFICRECVESPFLFFGIFGLRTDRFNKKSPPLLIHAVSVTQISGEHTPVLIPLRIFECRTHGK